MTGFRPSDEQRAILGDSGRALRISAGAGTGKTTTIVQRLARAVVDGADPARALGITFTNKAADELRDRLRRAVPARPDGREVEVSTYHGFAASILDEFGARYGWTGGATIMDEGHRFELAARVLRAADDGMLDLTKIPSLRKEVLAVADALNENLTDGDAVRAVAPREPDDVWRTRLALVAAAERYEDAKRSLGLVEYADLIRMATLIVEGDRDVARRIAGRYDMVLLDEYQDTDRAQRRLLTAAFTDGPTVTAVGDADQTIYEWRGASLRNFEEFPTDFPVDSGAPAPTLPLSINRRSERRIIDLANRVRTRIPSIEGSRDLRPRPDAGSGRVRVSWHATEDAEATWIADHIAQRHDDEGIPYAETAILCRRRDSLRVVSEALRSAEIPFTVSSMSDLLDVPEITDLHAWLRIVADPTDERALLRIVLGGRYRLGLGDVARIRRTVAKGAPMGLMGAILDDAADAVLEPEMAGAVGSFASTYRALLADAQAASVSATVDAIVEAVGLWDEVAALPPAASTTARLNLSRFIDLAGRWRPLSGTGDLAGFLRYLDALAEPGRAEELDAAEPPTGDAVLLTTAHGAKGLEWSDVYIADVAHGVFPSGVRDYYEPLSKASALPYGVRLDAADLADVAALDDSASRKALLKARHEHQEWRLAYVAVTRAKRFCSLSGHMWHGDNTRPRRPGALLDLAMEDDAVEIGPVVDESTPRPEPRSVRPAVVPPDPLFPEGWAGAMRATITDPGWPTEHAPDLAEEIDDRRRQLELRLDGLAEPGAAAPDTPFVTSVTNLVALAECPLRFRWIHHERLPRKPRRSARRGTDFHRRVELHNLGVASLNEVLEVDGDEDREPESPWPGVDPWHVFSSSRFASEAPRFVETPFVITLDGRQVRGKVDAIYDDGDRWEIVDYKSGRASPTDAKRVQLEAYAVAADDGAFGAAPPGDLRVTFAWFGEDPVVETSEDADPRWLDEARRRLGGLLAVAEDGPFDPTPSAECRWCDFLHHCDAGKQHLAGRDDGTD